MIAAKKINNNRHLQKYKPVKGWLAARFIKAALIPFLSVRAFTPSLSIA